MKKRWPTHDGGKWWRWIWWYIKWSTWRWWWWRCPNGLNADGDTEMMILGVPKKWAHETEGRFFISNNNYILFHSLLNHNLNLTAWIPSNKTRLAAPICFECGVAVALANLVARVSLRWPLQALLIITQWNQWSINLIVKKCRYFWSA